MIYGNKRMAMKFRISDMQKSPYRSAGRMRQVGFLMLVLACSMCSCSKNPAPGPPTISFIHGAGYLSHDTVIETGQKVKIGIRAVGPNANLTYFSVRVNNGTGSILLDTGMNCPSLVYNIELIKTTAPLEVWTFLIMDRNRVEQSVQIALTKSDSSAWGKIITLGDISLGAQENPALGSFFSLAANDVMTLPQAFENQQTVDLVYYYGLYEGTLASPNEAEAPGFFTGPQGIANWAVKNETRYDTTAITQQAFDLSTNDSLILSAYEPTAGKKKGKYALPGMVFSFKSPAGKLGLIKILEVNPLAAGSVKMTIKIQE